MYLADYHTHSSCSPDAHFPMEEMARAGVRAGLRELCFTDHVETVETDEIRTGAGWDELQSCFARAGQAVPDIQLRLGMELGGASLDTAAADAIMDNAPPLDFIIGSVHALSNRYDRKSLYYFRCRSESEARLAIADYLSEAEKLARWGRFDVLGHLTLPLRYLNENQGMHMTFDGFEEQVAEIFRLLIAGGRGIEVNTNRGNTPLPDARWLRLYRELGGEIVTIGSDAHSPEYVGCAVAQTQALLKDCGFTHFCTFQNRRPAFHAL